MNANPQSTPAVRLVSRAEFPSRYGNFEIYGFEHLPTGEPFVVLARGPLDGETVPLLRIHSQCLTGDALGSRRCDCGYQLRTALRLIQESGCGLLIYQLQEGRGIGILNKLRSYQLQDKGADTVEANEMLGFEADLREYAACGGILHSLGVGRVRLLSNNPSKIRALEAAGIRVTDRIPLEMPPDELSSHYLKAKKDKLGHLLDQV
ncbi:MAG: GTP cyclohydrolase II [Acidobacteria bacterium]|nr:GTP cyclohydrolase II [Acidobacteriota bacterium]